MKKSKLHRITSLLMAFLMLVSSTGFSIDLHYCQGNLKSFSFLGTAKSCHDIAQSKHCSKMKKSCHAPKTALETDGECQKDCCSNKKIEVSPDDENQKIQIENFSLKQIKFVTAFVKAFVLPQTDLSQIIVPHLKYKPPLLNRDIPILVQSFLL